MQDFTVPSLKSEHMELARSAAAHAVEVPDIEGYQVVQRRAWEKKYVYAFSVKSLVYGI